MVFEVLIENLALVKSQLLFAVLPAFSSRLLRLSYAQLCLELDNALKVAFRVF